ncbi:ATP synthase subunit d, mitochondrial-like [Hyposmocoma kahamanoa]|uniref:ATP synthase subunit d, mitochondrial-like n=1 Tax=Hyposmocoma kahamanoa TaxID=1477025 RepID=UPI000E6DA479|nr:ATP synthase subunit d, mitochondrial-like [Hyposmocoma kahamanoa]
MAKRFTKSSIDWVALEKRVPRDQKNQFLVFKAKSDGYLRRVLANPEKPPEINWAEYQKSVPVEGLVEKFKSQYQSLQVPFPNDTLSAEIDKQWSAIEPGIKAFRAEMQKEIDAANKQLQRINALPKFEDMHMEMFKDMYPEEALDPVNRPTFWPHNPEEQPGYKPPNAPAAAGH